MNEEAIKDNSVRLVFRKWERLRLFYNLILVAALLIRQPPLWAWLDALFYGNVLYFFGPSVEGYVEWLGEKRKWIMQVLFISGVVLSIGFVFFWY